MPLHSELVLPADAPIAFGAATLGVDGTLLTLSPDGRLLVYVGRVSSGGCRLYRRDLTSFEAPEPIPGTEGAICATFSPDGRVLAVVTFGRVERISPDGDSRVTLCTAGSVISVQWAADGWIYLGTDEARTLQRVPEHGGELETLAVMPRGAQHSEVRIPPGVPCPCSPASGREDAEA
ncbi:MAG: hypothetical protein GY711_32225 [bacterium]|nr:hypothetical protein [bacterium]